MGGLSWRSINICDKRDLVLQPRIIANNQTLLIVLHDVCTAALLYAIFLEGGDFLCRMMLSENG